MWHAKPVLPLEMGRAAVRYARSEAEAEVLRGRALPAPRGLEERRGAFVTLHREGELRGCVGYPEPAQPLRAALRRAARGAARDPRFEPVKASELARLLVEVSVLTPPVPLAAKPEVLPSLLRVGDHGLLLEAGRRRGLLLPQVAVEHGLDAEGFLGACCAKAGLDPDAWRADGLRWHVFEAEVFQERAPRGVVEAARRDRPEVA